MAAALSGLKRPFAAGLMISAGLLLGACESAEPPAPPAEAEAEAVTPAPTSANTFVERRVNVTLGEGTNLAVAVDPVRGDRVISLQGTLFLLPVAGGEAVALTDAYYDAREPQFSADGRQVVFQGYRNGNWDLWLVGRDGQPPKALTQDPFDDREPHYSADDASVVFSSDRSGRYDVWRIDLVTGVLSQLTETGRNAYAPAESASGLLAYVEEGSGQSRVMVRRPDGGQELLVEEAGVISGVKWSPDESQLAYQLIGAKGAELKVVSLAKKISRTVSQPGADVFPFKPHWMTADQLVYAADGKVVKRNINGGEREDCREPGADPSRL